MTRRGHERMTASSPLTGLKVVVTRPARQADGLCRRLREAGAEAMRFPALEIVPPENAEVERALLHARWQHSDLAVFVSANAVRGARQLLGRRHLPAGGPQVACVGPATARALARAGRNADLVPEQSYDSEGLLALEALQGDLQGLQVLVIRGDGGRELLSRTLRERGARVSRVSVYRRRRPDPAPERIARVWEQSRAPDVVTATSPQILDNLLGMLPGGVARERLLASRLVVVSERMVDTVTGAGFEHAPLVAANAGDKAVVDCLISWCAGKQEDCR